MKTKFLFIDAETDGLYGSFLTVGVVVTDALGNIIQKAYGFKFINPVFMLFDKDINIDELDNEVALIKDATGHTYLCNYIKQK